MCASSKVKILYFRTIPVLAWYHFSTAAFVVESFQSLSWPPCIEYTIICLWGDECSRTKEWHLVVFSLSTFYLTASAVFLDQMGVFTYYFCQTEVYKFTHTICSERSCKTTVKQFTLELSLNSFTEFAEFSDRKIKIKKENCRVGTQDLLCKRQRLYHCTTETIVREQILVLNLIHASVISQFLWILLIQWIQWKFCSILRKSYCYV